MGTKDILNSLRLIASKKKQWLLAMSVASLHYFASVWCVRESFLAGMAAFETDRAFNAEEILFRLLADVLTFPLVALTGLLPGRWFPGVWGYTPFVLNSVFWGAFAGFLFIAHGSSGGNQRP